MGTQQYKSINFKPQSIAMIETINKIVADYVRQGYRLTVRQLYYQLVSKAIIENTERSYKNITGLVNDGKLAGLIDWEAIEDRTRAFIQRSHWGGGADILRGAARSFHMDMWHDQDFRVFCIVEKEALAGVLEGVCHEFDVPLLAARGYPSGTVLREFAVSDLIPAVRADQEIVILHLGDHDPSGIDMTRDLAERFYMFITGKPGKRLSSDNFRRIALNMPQIEELRPPPNPAKVTDARFESYQRTYGDSSWELDALEPQYLNDLVRQHVEQYVESDKWQRRVREIEDIKARIVSVAAEFEDAEGDGNARNEN